MSESKWLSAQISGRTVTLPEVSDNGKPWPRSSRYCYVKVKEGRNLGHHRKYWGLLRRVVDASGQWPSVEILHRWVKYQLRMFTPVEIRNGNVILEWDSIDFESMDQREFNDFYDRALAEISLEIGVDPETLGVEL